jgi:Nucleoside 2-deoxyribosyltransferase like
MIEIQAPQQIPKSDKPKVFLAGSIEMGFANPWQKEVIRLLKDEDIYILNPRRLDWDSSWKQTKDDPNFREQVEWELQALSLSTFIILYLDPLTKSPISLLEMGLFAQSGKLLVVCPEGFWRKGNVDIVCEKYGFPQFESLDLLLSHLRRQLHQNTDVL